MRIYAKIYCKDYDYRTTHSLRRIDDGFQKIVVTGDHGILSYDEHGILFINLYDFLSGREV